MKKHHFQTPFKTPLHILMIIQPQNGFLALSSASMLSIFSQATTRPSSGPSRTDSVIALICIEVDRTTWSIAYPNFFPLAVDE